MLFFVFFEVVLLPMYAVIAVWGGPERRHAARKFVLYTLLGSVLLLVGVFTVVVSAGTADLVALTSDAGGLPPGTQLAAFILLALAFAVKSPLWPLHTWLPDAHTEAPTVGSVILAGVLLKMGTYGLLRVAVGVAPDGRRGGRAGARRAGRGGHHRRWPGLPGPDRAEAAHRVLLGRPHGLRPARHRHAHQRPASRRR